MLLKGTLFGPSSWRPKTNAHPAVKLFLKALGLRTRAPSRESVLARFFNEKAGIAIPIRWRRRLGGDFSEAERRCIRLQQLEAGDQTARVLFLDTFNELLLQNFSQAHAKLSLPYRTAAGGHPHPDYGRWLTNPVLAAVLPKGVVEFRAIHQARVGADLSHAKSRGGKGKGKPTLPVSHKDADDLARKVRVAWAELIMEWSKL